MFLLARRALKTSCWASFEMLSFKSKVDSGSTEHSNQRGLSRKQKQMESGAPGWSHKSLATAETSLSPTSLCDLRVPSHQAGVTLWHAPDLQRVHCCAPELLGRQSGFHGDFLLWKVLILRRCFCYNKSAWFYMPRSTSLENSGLALCSLSLSGPSFGFARTVLFIREIASVFI